MIDRQTQKILDDSKAAGLVPLHWLQPAAARKRMESIYVVDEEAPPVAGVRDLTIPFAWGALPVRIYIPEGEAPFPVIVFFHGGGWVLNSIETHDSVCRHLARLSEAVVVSVGYRLSPECKFPGPLEDAYGATAWVRDNAASFSGRPDRIAVAGDSSGGNFAAAVALLARDRGGPKLSLQILIYPAVDYVFPGTPSYVEKGTGFLLTRDQMFWFWNQYLESGEDVDNPYICPLRAASLAGLPPAQIYTAEHDLLRDEGELYAARLRGDDVDVSLKRYDGLMHGFVTHWRLVDRGMRALEEIGAAAREALYRH